MRILIPLLLLFSTPAMASESRADQVAGLEAIRDGDLRVATVGERLAVGNVALCGQTQYRTGLLLHDIAQYAPDMQDAAREAFGFATPVAVEAVVSGSPADRAGVVADSGLLSVEGQAVETIAPVRGQGAFARMAALLDRVETASSDQRLVLATVRNGVRSETVIQPVRGCASRFQLVLEGGINAGADGQYVQIEGRMVDFVQSDTELAAVLAHELAHNILEHRRRLNAIGTDRGMFGVLGKSGRWILATEIEADRLSVYLMANAGYDPHAVPAFRDRLGRQTGYGIFSDGTHLGRKSRVALFQRELVALDALRARTPAGAPLIPDFARRPFAPLR